MMRHKGTISVRAAAGMAGAIAVLVALSGCGNSVERQVQQMADEMNKSLPKQIDPVTRLDRVEAGPGKQYSYIYTLSMNLTDQQKQAIQSTTTAKALTTPEMQSIFAAGVTIWYKYYDAKGTKLLEFPVKK